MHDIARGIGDYAALLKDRFLRASLATKQSRDAAADHDEIPVRRNRTAGEYSNGLTPVAGAFFQDG